MPTENMYLQGKGKYVRIFEPDIQFPRWNLLLYPDTPSLEKIKELQKAGIKNKLKKDDDGYNMTFSRPTFKENKKTGVTIPFSPPYVTDKNDLIWDRTVKIGDGSDLTIGLDVYDHGVPGTTNKAKAARLKSVRVENLVPYTAYVKEETDPLAIKDQPKIQF
jgi:hypothetical protein